MRGPEIPKTLSRKTVGFEGWVLAVLASCDDAKIARITDATTEHVSYRLFASIIVPTIVPSSVFDGFLEQGYIKQMGTSTYWENSFHITDEGRWELSRILARHFSITGLGTTFRGEN